MEWQNVEKGKTNKDTKKEGSKSKEVALPKAGKGPVNLESNSAFSVLDNWEEKMAAAQEERKKKADERQKNASKVVISEKVALSFDPIEFKVPFVAPGSQQQPKKEKKKEEAAPKPREEKLPLDVLVSRLNVAELRQLLEETQSRYTNDTDRILRVADFLLSGLDNCSLQFSRSVRDSPFKSVGLLFKALPADRAALLGEWVARRDVTEAAAALTTILTAACDVFAAPDKGPFKMGLAMMLTLFARYRPQAVAAVAPELLGAGKRGGGAVRLPLVAWLLLETAEADPSCALHAALHGLAPSLPGAAALKDAPTAPLSLEASPLVIDLLEAILKQRKSGSSLAIAPAAYCAFVRAAFVGGEAGPVMGKELQRRAQGVADGLRERVFAQDTLKSTPRPELLIALLECAAAGSGEFEGPQSPLVLHCTRDVTRCVLQDGSALVRWRAKHAQYVKGSARVLQCLALRPGKELPEGAKVRGMREFREALEGMLRKQEHLVTGGGVNARAARAAHAAMALLHPKGALQALPEPVVRAAGNGNPPEPRSKYTHKRLPPSQRSTVASLLQALGSSLAIAAAVAVVSWPRMEPAKQEMVLTTLRSLQDYVMEEGGAMVQQAATLARKLNLPLVASP